MVPLKPALSGFSFSGSYRVITIGTLHPTDNIPSPPDTVQTLLIAGSSGQAMDWNSAASAGAGAVHIARFTGVSTLGVLLNFNVNLASTKAAAPSSGLSTQGTTGFNHPVIGQGSFQIPVASTGFSVAALSSGYIQVEVWRK